MIRWGNKVPKTGKTDVWFFPWTRSGVIPALQSEYNVILPSREIFQIAAFKQIMLEDSRKAQ